MSIDAGLPGPLQGGMVASVGLSGVARTVPSANWKATVTGGTGAGPQ
jgi:hypothetical protein